MMEDKKMSPQSAEREENSHQEGYELYMLGFRLGCPVEGDPLSTIPDTNSSPFQRGLADGKAVAQSQLKSAVNTTEEEA